MDISEDVIEYNTIAACQATETKHQKTNDGFIQEYKKESEVLLEGVEIKI